MRREKVLKVKTVPAETLEQLAKVVCINAETTAKATNQLLKDVRRLKRGKVLALIFGIITCYRISELEYKVDKLSMKANVDKEE